uniref:Dehydrogenase/reductase 13 n=1 Tax=Oncorhynchus kisutch TaxID=8019 RepID=A0A8C7G0C1_ONCKI
GARVIPACRSKQKAEAAVYDIRRGNEMVFMQLHLGSLKSVRSFAETFLKTKPRLGLLINNAGMLGPGHTEDGFGMAFRVNHLGHFLLTCLLLDRLKQCSVDFVLLGTHKDLVPGRSTWLNFRAYCHSKLCNVVFNRVLANCLDGTSITTYSLHPEHIELLSGHYFSSCALQDVGAKGRDDALARKLWEVIERLSDLS